MDILFLKSSVRCHAGSTRCVPFTHAACDFNAQTAECRSLGRRHRDARMFVFCVITSTNIISSIGGAGCQVRNFHKFKTEAELHVAL